MKVTLIEFGSLVTTTTSPRNWNLNTGPYFSDL